MADLFLPDRLRLSEQQRAVVRGLLDKTVRAVEDELRAGLLASFEDNPGLHGALSSAHVEIAGPLLASSPALQEPELLAMLLRRAEEHRLFVSGGGAATLLLDLVGDENGAIAGAAMAVLVAQSRRFDRFQEPALARTELPADLQHKVVWTVAAALRLYMIRHHQVSPAAADAALCTAVGALLAGYDEGDTLEARALRLAKAAEAAGRLDSGFLTRSLLDGSLSLFIASLSIPSGLQPAAIAELLLGEGDGAVLLLRACSLQRAQAAAILLRLGPGAEARLDRFDVTSEAEARDALLLWRTDAAYRAAIVRVGEGA
jgi:uncharacterized protein (DUF2336 family)